MIQRRIVGAVLGVVFGTLLAIPPSRADFIVANFGNNTVVNVTAAGVVTANSSGYNEPFGVALNPSGTTLYVSNESTNTVSSVAASGGTPATFIPSSSGLLNPAGLAIDSSGNIYVADLENSRIAKFDASGNVINANFITGLNTPAGVAVDSSGNVYVTDTSAHTLKRYTSAGGSTPNFTVSGFTGSIPAVTLGTGSFAGFAFVADLGNNTVQKVDLSTGSTVQFNTSGSALNHPNGLTFDNNGNLFVTNDVASGFISEITPSGVTSTFATSGLSLSGPTGIVFVPAAVPEPSSLLLSGLGVSVLYACRRWKRRGAEIGS
jgi:DNA-binding beta-propeller fold protein YncE